MNRDEFLHDLMGNPARVEAAAWIYSRKRNEFFSQDQVRQGTGLRQAAARDAVEDLKGVGLLEVIRSGPHRWPSYRLIESPVWPALAALWKAVMAMEQGVAAPALEARTAPEHPASPLPRASHRGDPR
jgi:hypothetical protein